MYQTVSGSLKTLLIQTFLFNPSINNGIQEKLICADGRKNFDEPGYWELFSEFYYRDTNAPRYCRQYDRPNHAFKTPGKVCLDKNGDWEVQ